MSTTPTPKHDRTDLDRRLVRWFGVAALAVPWVLVLCVSAGMAWVYTLIDFQGPLQVTVAVPLLLAVAAVSVVTGVSMTREVGWPAYQRSRHRW